MANKSLQNEELVHTVGLFQELISSVRKEREFAKISKKQPLKSLKVHAKKNKDLLSIEEMRPYILEHANVQELHLGHEFNNFVKVSTKPNIEKLKELFENKAKFAIIFPKIKNLTQE